MKMSFLFESFLRFLKEHSFWLSIGLVSLSGIWIYWPSHDFLPFLVQGDLGRDLYAYQRTLEGGVPYRDYYYAYGPLVPYYYAFFFKLFGVQIPSIIFGKIVLNILSGILIYLSLALWIRPLFAILGALWFFTFSPHLLHTFHHNAGVTALLWVIYVLLSYFKKQETRKIYFLVIALAGLFLIKINMGLVVLVGVMFSLFIASWPDKNLSWIKKFQNPLLVFLGSLVLSGIIYGFLFWGLPEYFIKQCLLIFPGYDQHRDTVTIFGALRILVAQIIFGLKYDLSDISLTSIFSGLWPHRVFVGLFVFATGRLICLLSKKGYRGDFGAQKWFVLTALVSFLILVSHEFLFSGVFYRLFWVNPITILLTFFLVGVAFESRSLYKITLATIVFMTIFFGVYGQYEFKTVLKEYPQCFLSHPKAQVYVKNSGTWVDVMTKTADYLDTHLKSNESFLAIPYDPLYNYLSGCPAPGREIIFFDYLNIPREQEEGIIADLEEKKVRYVLLSSRWKSEEAGLGEFGKTYCPILAEYLQRNFVVVKSIGEWTGQPVAWFEDHATRIYRRWKKDAL